MEVKAEIAEGVSQLSRRSEFSIVTFSSEPHRVWKSKPQPSTTGNKMRAKAWLSTVLPVAYSPCIIEAAHESLRILERARSSSSNKQLFLLYSREPSCGQLAASEAAVEGAIESITNANRDGVTINTLFVPEVDPEYSHSGGAGYRVAMGFGQALASANNGSHSLHIP